MPCSLKPLCAIVLLFGLLTTSRTASAEDKPSDQGSPQPVCPLDHGQWALIPELSDEFDGNALDPTKWTPTNPQWLGREPGFFSKSNVSVSDGKLKLTARVEKLPNLPPGYHTFTTAAVKSLTRASYGYYEVRCRPMKSRVSSSFWFYTAEPNWWTEIDVFEICGGDSEKFQNIVHSTMHVWETPEHGKGHRDTATTWKSPVCLSDDFHSYGFEWTAKDLKVYFDGQVISTIPNTDWHQALHMNFDSETMPEWFGLPDPATLPATFTIDYVRSWRETSTEPPHDPS